LCRTCVFASDGLCGSRIAFWCIWHAKRQHTIFTLRWAGAVYIKSAPEHVTSNLCFCIKWDLRATKGITVRSGNETSTHYFLLGWALSGSHKKRIRTRHAELVFLHLVGSSGDVMHSGTSGMRNIDKLFSCSGGSSAVFIKSTRGHIMPNMCFCIRWDLRVT
jgi:hypothetical protein